MFGYRGALKNAPPFNFPKTKLKNVTCVHCKHQFIIRELLHMRGQQVPLLLECGHSVCYGCAKSYPSKPCSLCKVPVEENERSAESYPLNIYALGLVVIANNRPVHGEDPDISFYQTMFSKRRHIHNQGTCYECEVEATLRCPQCNALYCQPCYSKIHGRALQKHTKVPLTEILKNTPLIVESTCSDTCKEFLGYFCKDCQICSCSHCMLRLHSKHDHITLQERNEELMESFYKAYDEVAESLERIQQTQKKLKTIHISPNEIQNHETVEASITQHFAHLHGVLQNIESKMIDKICERRVCFNKNLMNLESQLRSQQDRLQGALLMAANVKDNLERIDIEEVVCKLKEIADVPCHLVQNLLVNDEKVLFEADKSIIDALEKHCTLNMPSISEFSLLRTKLLPVDYQVEPLTREIATFGNNAPANEMLSVPKKITSTSSLISAKSKNRTAPSELVKVMNVVDPSWFYVQLWSNQKQAEKLSKSLQACSATASQPTKEITTGKMYMVEYAREKIWRRGRVMKVNSQTALRDNTYDILYVDSGYYERNVSITRLRMISPQHASVPILATKCSLHDVVPNGGRWSKVAVEEFRKLTEMNVPLTMYVFCISGNTNYVDLCFYSNGIEGTVLSMRDTLVLTEHGNYVSLHRLMRTNPLSVQKFFREELEMEKYVEVAVKCVESPDRIYVTKIGENPKHVNKLMKDMAAFYERNGSSPTLTCQLEIGIPCAVLHLDGLWYRGVITRIRSEEIVDVFCVDFGYFLSTTHEMLRRLTINYMSIRTQAIQVSLKDLKPLPENKGQWNPQSISFMQKYLTNQKVRVIAMNKTNDVYSVYLYVHGSTSLSVYLANKKLEDCVGATALIAAQMPTSSSTSLELVPVMSTLVPMMPELALLPAPTWTDKKRRPKRKSIKSDQSSTTCYPVEVNKEASNVQTIEPDAFKVRVKVHRALSPDCIYVSDVTRQEANVELIAKMQDFYSKYHSQEEINWTIDAVCAVYSTRDKNYLRARVLNILSKEEVLVFFYDMAIEEVISVKNIQPLHTTFQQEPAYCFKVKLAGILPCGGSNTWPTLSCQKLSEIIAENQSCHFYITKVADTEDSTEIPVQLWMKQSRTDGPLSPTKIEINSVNKMLVAAGLALPVKGYNDKMVDKILAVEFKRQLQEMQVTSVQIEGNIKWFSTSKATSGSTDESSEEEEYSSTTNITNVSSPQEFTDWLPPLPIKSNNFIAVPTYVDDNGVVYLHPKRTGKVLLQQIEAALNDFYKKVQIRPCDKEWKEGDICIAQYHFTKKWYRGKITKILDKDMLEVTFVDYGNIEECAIGTVKKRTILSHIPIQCTACVVSGLYPDNEEGTWNRDDLDKIHALLVEKDCKVSVIERKDTHLIVSITLLKPKKCDLISYLTNELGIRLSPNPINSNDSEMLTDTYSSNTSTDSPDVIIEKYTNADKTMSDLCTDSELIAENIIDVDHIISGNSALIPDSGDIANCTNSSESFSLDTEMVTREAAYSTPQVASVENLATYIPLVIPDDIDAFEVELCVTTVATVHYVQLGQNLESKILNDYYNRYHQLMEDIQKDAAEQPLIKTLVPDTPCCAMFSDGVWYRCVIRTSEVVEGTDEVKISLYYVDFGNEEDRQLTLDKSGLRTLKEEWLSVPTMAIKCHLWNIVVPDGVDFLSLAQELEKMYTMYNRYTIVKIKERYENYLDVELYVDRKCKKLLYCSLIKWGYLQVKKTKED